jgi:hypothetical protein
VQRLNYILSLIGDENINIDYEKVEIPLESSRNKLMKKPYVGGVPSLGAKVS